MKSEKKLIQTLLHAGLAALIAFSLANCKSGSKKEDQEIKDSDGNKIGTFVTDSDESATAKYDRDNNGVVEKKVKLSISEDEDGKETLSVNKVIFDKDQDGKKDQVVYYENGYPSKVDVFNGEDEVRGKAYMKEGKISYVDLPTKGKRVFFNEDGSIKEIEEMP